MTANLGSVSQSSILPGSSGDRLRPLEADAQPVWAERTMSVMPIGQAGGGQLSHALEGMRVIAMIESFELQKTCRRTASDPQKPPSDLPAIGLALLRARRHRILPRSPAGAASTQLWGGE
jgi:hypothetical protein